MAEADSPRRSSSSEDWKPVPDPTLLTTQQLMAAISALKELLFTRLDAMDKAVVLLSDSVNRVPTDTTREVSHLKTLHEEKFEGIQRQFQERDVRAEQESRNNKVSLDAALQAAKEAVGKQNESFALSIAKSEASTMKQMEQQGQLIGTSNNALESKISDLKDRVTAIESKGIGQLSANTAHVTSSRDAWGIVAVVVAVVAVAVAVVIPIIIRG